MKTLQKLADEYKVLVNSDKPWQRRFRILQSMWRVEMGYACGKKHSGDFLGSRLEMPWAEETLANYLSETIRQVVSSEVKNADKSKGKVYQSPRIFNDLLSSQPLCFNLFAELQQDLELATMTFQTLLPDRVQKVTGIEFEYSPGREDKRYTDDRTAFDAYVEYQAMHGGRGFIGIEVKYHENMEVLPAEHRPRYDEIARQMNCFRQDCLERLKNKPLEQIWRDHLLAGSFRHADGFDEGLYVILYPRHNENCVKAVNGYRECLTNSDTFLDWTLEDVTRTINQNTQKEWIDLLIDRYLNLDKIDKALQAEDVS